MIHKAQHRGRLATWEELLGYYMSAKHQFRFTITHPVMLNRVKTQELQRKEEELLEKTVVRRLRWTLGVSRRQKTNIHQMVSTACITDKA